ncbi:MAG: PQQ-dependent sugar dehydrogenase [Gemmatimonadales bacterium]
MLLPLLLALMQRRDCTGAATPVVAPEGYCVRVFAARVGAVRHLVVHPSGTIVVATKTRPGLLRLRDTTGDGVADVIVPFGPGLGGTGVTWSAGWLYFAADAGVIRYRWPAGATAPADSGEWIARNLPARSKGSAHYMKGIAIGRDGTAYVSIGSGSDNCQMADRLKGSPGRWPCEELSTRAGIWQFTPPTGKGTWHGERYAAGLRNAMAIATDPLSGRVWAATHGRDYLNRVWGWPDSVSADQPAELLVDATRNADFGWPYCHGQYTAARTLLIRSPDYAGHRDIDCATRTPPAMGFPGHWAPMAIAVVAKELPAPWRNGLLVVFHGSRSRSPLPEQGHGVVFVPFDARGNVRGSSRQFIAAAGRPGVLRLAGIAVAPGGVVYLSDDDHGKIYRLEPRNRHDTR